MTIFNVIVIWSWIVFIFVWAAFSLNTKRSIYSGQWVKWALIRIVALVIIIFLARMSLLQGITLVPSNETQNQTLASVGAFLSVIGIAFAVWARVHLGRNWGMPMSVKEKPELVTSGPYALVRHPIYTGVLCALLGTTFVVGLGWLIIFLCGFCYFFYSAHKEEELMLKEFPQQYPRYREKTHLLIPFLW